MSSVSTNLSSFVSRILERIGLRTLPCGTPLKVFGECRNDEVMVEGAEAVGYVALDDPNCALPGPVDFSESRMTAPSFTKAMRVFAECPIEIGVQDHSHNLSKKFVAPNGYTERPLFPVFLQYVGSSGWLPLVSFLLQCSNDGLKGFQ